MADPVVPLYGPWALAVGVTSLTVTVSLLELERPSESVTVKVAGSVVALKLTVAATAAPDGPSNCTVLVLTVLALTEPLKITETLVPVAIPVAPLPGVTELTVGAAAPADGPTGVFMSAWIAG